MRRTAAREASRRNRLRTLAMLLTFLIPIPLGACGGGGGGGLPGGAGTLSGRVVLPANVFARQGKRAAEVLVEAEPNDGARCAQDLGALAAGDVVSVRGLLAGGDALDVLRICCPERVRVVAELALESSPAEARDNDVDLAAHDPTTLACVAVASSDGGAARLDLVTKGLLDLALRAVGEGAAWTLTLRAEALSESLALPAGPLDAGELLPGDTLRVDGHGATTLDLALPLAAQVLVESERPVRILAPYGEALVGPGPAVAGAAPASRARLTVLGAIDGGAYRLTLRALRPTAALPEGTLQADLFSPLARADAPWSRPTGASESYAHVGDALRAGQALVLPRAGVEADAHDALAAAGCHVLEAIPEGGACRVAVELDDLLKPEARAQATLARTFALSRCPSLVYAEPNHVRRRLAVPNDPRYRDQWHYPILRLPQAWDLTTGSASVIVAIIDTGITAHPDLAGKSVAGYDFIDDVANGNDGDGRDADPTDPGDGYDGEPASWHGTHVAGTVAAATNNGVGVAGVAWNCRLMNLRVLGPQGGDDFEIANAVLYAAGLSNVSGRVPAQRAHVINMSLGGGGSNATFQDACTRAHNAGVLVVAAAGNESTSQRSYPAAFANVLAVGAIDRTQALASYSNYGSWVDCVAPGGDAGGGVLSTLPDEAGTTYGYAEYEGTSMAAPHAAGVAALVYSVAPGLSASQVESVLVNSAQDLGSAGRDNTFGFGLLDAYAAVVLAQGGTPPPPPPPPPPGGEDPPPTDGDDTLWVLVVDAASDETIGQGSADADTLRYVIEGLPAGSFYLYAGTDLDGDGFIGDAGDLVGAWPDLDAPEALELGDGEARSDLRIPLLWADDVGFARRRR